VSGWHDSAARGFLYRALVKSRVELDKRTSGTPAVKRALARPARGNLSWLAAVYGSDKGATAHRYVDLYEQHLAPLRRSATKVLEIGIYRGASLQMWRDYFPRAEVIGVDIKEIPVPGPRIRTLVGDQSDPALLAKLAGEGPYDLVVDDGSHHASHIAASFAGLFDAVRPGGFYVIEDMHTAYWEGAYEGGPPGTGGTSVELVAGLLDGVNRRHVAERYPELAATLPLVDEIHVYPRIAFLRRG
jgi:hypothetical protein